MSSPIVITELLKLTTFGIEKSMIAPSKVSIHSARMIDCTKMIDDSEQIISVNIDPPHKRFGPSKVNSILLSPSHGFIACSDGPVIILKNAVTKQELKRHNLMEEKVVFWKWIDDETLSFVTAACVYQWEIDGQSTPVRRFRHSLMYGCKILDYRVTNGLEVLIGESTKNGRSEGKIQLFNSYTRQSLPIEAESACFAHFKFEGNRHPSNLFICSRKNDQGGKLFLEEVGFVAIGNKPFPKMSIDVPFEQGFKDDYPIFLKASDSQGVVYIATKRGFLHLYDIESGSIFYTSRISEEPIIIAAEDKKEGGVIGVNSEGKVFSCCIDNQTMIESVAKSNAELSLKLAKRWEKNEDAKEATEPIPLKNEPCVVMAKVLEEINAKGERKNEGEGEKIIVNTDHEAANTTPILESPPGDPSIPSVDPQLSPPPSLCKSTIEETEEQCTEYHNFATSPVHNRPLPLIPQERLNALAETNENELQDASTQFPSILIPPLDSNVENSDSQLLHANSSAITDNAEREPDYATLLAPLVPIIQDKVDYDTATESDYSNDEEHEEDSKEDSDLVEKAERERDEIADRYRELKREHRKALIIIGKRVVARKTKTRKTKIMSSHPTAGNEKETAL